MTSSEGGRPALRARLGRADRAATAAIALGWPHPRWLTVPLAALSLAANYGILWFLLAAVPWLGGAERGFLVLLYSGGAVLVTEWLTYAVKLAFRRRRPPADDPSLPQHIPLPASHSFPSSHASMGVAGLLTLGSLYPAWVPALAALTAALAFSRVHLGVHYLADVLAGLALGAVIGAAWLLVVPSPL